MLSDTEARVRKGAKALEEARSECSSFLIITNTLRKTKRQRTLAWICLPSAARNLSNRVEDEVVDALVGVEAILRQFVYDITSLRQVGR